MAFWQKRWQKGIIESRVKSSIKKLYKINSNELAEIKDKTADLIELQPNEINQLTITVILCSEIIAGFEQKEDRETILKMLGEIMGKLKD